jgi:hypothetical protein
MKCHCSISSAEDCSQGPPDDYCSCACHNEDEDDGPEYDKYADLTFVDMDYNAYGEET